MDRTNIKVTFTMLARLKLYADDGTMITRCTCTFRDNPSPLESLLRELNTPSNGYPYRVSLECIDRYNTVWDTDSTTQIEAFHTNAQEIRSIEISRAADMYSSFHLQGHITFWRVKVKPMKNSATGKCMNLVSFDYAGINLDYIKAVSS